MKPKQNFNFTIIPLFINSLQTTFLRSLDWGEERDWIVSSDSHRVEGNSIFFFIRSITFYDESALNVFNGKGEAALPRSATISAEFHLMPQSYLNRSMKTPYGICRSMTDPIWDCQLYDLASLSSEDPQGNFYLRHQ